MMAVPDVMPSLCATLLACDPKPLCAPPFSAVRAIAQDWAASGRAAEWTQHGYRLIAEVRHGVVRVKGHKKIKHNGHGVWGSSCAGCVGGAYLTKPNETGPNSEGRGAGRGCVP